MILLICVRKTTVPLSCLYRETIIKISVCKFQSVLFQIMGQLRKKVKFFYPFITATGSSRVLILTKSRSFAITSSMFLYAPDASCISS